LHWFRWEAFTTWFSGFLLLILIYYLGGGVLIDPDVRQMSVGVAVALGIGTIVAGGLIYDLMMMSPLARNEKLFAAVAYVLIVALSFGLTRIFSARAAYLHVGAMFGTIMAANVWMHILPAQKRMIAALNEGRKPDDRLSAQAKLRSKQNTFMAVPVVFIMISHHYPGVTYGDRYNWIILSALILLGWIAAKFIRRA
jgi:uncharacterized membrane protein